MFRLGLGGGGGVKKSERKQRIFFKKLDSATKETNMVWHLKERLQCFKHLVEKQFSFSNVIKSFYYLLRPWDRGLTCLGTATNKKELASEILLLFKSLPF